MIGGDKFSLSSLLAACLVLAGMWMIFREAETTKPVNQERMVKAELPQA
jgi:hypothetical protein